MSENRAERRLAAILAADVAGYSRLMGADEEGTLAALKAIRRELGDPKVAEHRGRIVKTTGDGMLVEFASVVDAVRCAVEVQQGMAERNAGVPDEKRIEFRIGINLGDIIIDEDDIFGDGVNIAARLEALAEPGGICVSRVVRDQVRDRLDIAFDDKGEQQVKNIARPVHVFAVRTGPWASRPQSTADAGETPAVQAGALPLPDKPSLAVLPFQNMSGDPEQEYFADGMVEEITTAIARLPWLFVIARNSSFTYKGKAVDVKQIGRELGVRYVLEGSVRKGGNRVRITGQLIDTATGAHIWADRFDGALDDVFELQDQVASSVAGAIEPKLMLAEIERAVRKPTGSLAAYDHYLRAMAQLYKFTEPSVDSAISLAFEALALDPSCAPAAGLIGWCRLTQALQNWGSLSSDQIAEAVRLANQAVETGKDDPGALWMAASCLAIFAGDHATAMDAADRALTLNPNSAYAWTARGYVAALMDQPDPAIEAQQRAMRLSPLDPMGYLFLGGMCIALLLARRFEEAVDWADRALRTLPRWSVMLRYKAVACAHLGRIDEARNWVRVLLESQPGFTTSGWLEALGSKAFTPETRAMLLEGMRLAGLPEG
jgi:TolB-like protein/class 3 adenylate cyclase